MQISKAGRRAHAPVTMSFIDNSPKLETSNVHLHVKGSVNYAMFLLKRNDLLVYVATWVATDQKSTCYMIPFR